MLFNQISELPDWVPVQRRLIWVSWGVLVLGVSLLFCTYLYSVRDQVRQAAWAEGRAASRMLQWQLKSQMQHLDDVLLHTCESFERLGSKLTEKDALFKGRMGMPTPYEHMFILGPQGQSMLSLPHTLSSWGDSQWLEQARQHGMGQLITMVLPKQGQPRLARVLPVWSEAGEFKGAVVGLLPSTALETLVRETAQAYGLNLTLWHRSTAVTQSPTEPVPLEDATMFSEQMRLPELDLMLDLGLRQDAVVSRLAMAWQWLLLTWAFMVLCLSWGAHWLHRTLSRQVRVAAQLKTEQEATRVRASFLANMSHELRTPMMGVLGAAELLEGASQTDQARLLQMIRDSGRHLLGLLNNVLDFTRLESGAMPLELREISPLDLLQEVVQSFAVQVHQRRVALYSELAFTGDLRLRLDGFRLSQVLTNLLGNAFKFTDQGAVRLQAGVQQEHDQSRLWVRITDTGIGMSSQEQSRLFKPFSQADDSTSRRYGGSGLGLVIVRQLLDRMDGDIHIQSTQGRGTVVSFSMPVEVINLGTPTPQPVGLWHVAIEDEVLRATVLNHLHQAGANTRTGPLTLDLPALVRVVDEPTWQHCKAHTQDTATGLWLVVSGTDVALEVPPEGTAHTVSLHALQPRQDWLSVVARFAAELQRQLPTTSTLVAGQQTPSILVAEDNEMTRQILARFLSETRYQIDFAPDGLVALELWRQKSYDMAILDCHMPGLDGFTVAQKIRAVEKREQRKPLVALTAATLQEDVARCMQAGIDEVWSKPISKAQLLANVQRWLQPQH